MQVAAVYAYLAYPLVLSWSLMDAVIGHCNTGRDAQFLDRCAQAWRHERAAVWNVKKPRDGAF